ncbi:PA3496 family putative envelope integrity protein [Thiothrix lacustris]|uniref:Uncharacterized protein n=1 Tax=Thiothrix lacustris TaxID=525917 RepID=A0ABY9MU69_9GAMM|nr:hypothetical protein [Thiothrix lacustris]WML91336.1 hypothetical protein RCF98_03040 [Thiothrix lacustris]WMP16811.1 hypothetical protein RCS87_15710 [Thiothrix lacustris]
MRNSKEYYTEQEDEIFQLEKATTVSLDCKKIKPHVVRRNVEDYLERKALERRIKDVFDYNDA